MTESSQSIAQMRVGARRALPKAVFDFADGGAEDERTLRANEAAFAQFDWLARPLRGAAQRDLTMNLFGQPLAMPLMIGPAGLAGLFWPDGELLAARAAHRAGIGLCLSHGSVCTLEALAKEPVTPRWMQVFIYRDRSFTEHFVERAEASGYDALVLTIDNQLIGKRERDRHNGFGIPPKFNTVQKLAMLSRWRWLLRMRSSLPSLTFGNYGAYLGIQDPAQIAASMADMLDPAMSWQDVQWLRKRWSGPLLIKGILHPEEARRAVDSGIDGIICSNHGGRQLDGAVASLTALPAIRQAVGGTVPVLLDGGIRRGGDIAKALALGATACLVARPWLWGLASNGEDGIVTVLDIFREELDRTMGLLGCKQLTDLDASCLQQSLVSMSR